MSDRTPQELVSSVATVLRLPVSKVRNFDRQLMEAGLRSKKGHGRGSAVMNYADAAMLLAAIASSDEISHAAECVSTARKLPFATFSHKDEDGDDLAKQILRSSILAEIGSPRDFTTFGRAIDSVMKYLVAERRRDFFSIEIVTVSGEPLAAYIIISSRGQIISSKHSVDRIEFYRRGTEKTFISGGLRVSRTVQGPSISGIAEIISGRALPVRPEELS
jgi:hypothetical protein